MTSKPNYVVDRDGFEFTMGSGLIHGKPADLSHSDHDMIRIAERKWSKPIPARHLEAVVRVMRAFPGSSVDV